MDQSTNAQCSHDLGELDTAETQEIVAGSDTASSNEICTNTIDLNAAASGNVSPPRPFHMMSSYSYYNRQSAPLVILSKTPSLVTRPSICPQTNMPSNLPSPSSFVSGQPQSLFLQALAKLNETSLTKAVANHFNIQQVTDSTGRTVNIIGNADLSTPDSLASAPPSYSFVLRQMAVRRRPRMVGTFIPSPSFVQHSPPPNYAAAFDIYVDNPIAPPPTRVYNFGFASMPVVCPDCGYTGMTLVTSKITLCTHLCAIILCILCCWVCAPLPYILRSCKDVYHYCSNCRNFLGIYRPTNPDNTYS